MELNRQVSVIDALRSQILNGINSYVNVLMDTHKLMEDVWLKGMQWVTMTLNHVMLGVILMPIIVSVLDVLMVV